MPNMVKKYDLDNFKKCADTYINDCVNNKKVPNFAGLCVFLQISDTTFYKYRDLNDDFAEAVALIMLDIEANCINDKTQNSDKIKMYLKARHKDVYQETQKIEITTKKLEDIMQSLDNDNDNQ